MTDRALSERAVLVTAALGTMLAPLNSTMIVVALPEILDEFNRSLAWGSWIVLSYLVAMAAVQPLGGSLGDRYGRKRLFLLGLVVFAMATVVAAFAWRIEVLIVARTVQAISGATAIPNGTALIRSLIPPGRQGRAFGTIGSGIAVAAALGPPLGGLLTDSLGWRWIFAANLLLITPALVLGLRLRDASLPGTGRFDLRGATLLTLSLVTLALALTIWRVDGVPIGAAPLLGAIALASGMALLRQTRRVERPVLNLGLFRRRAYLPATLTVLLGNLTMYTLLLSLPIFMTGHKDWSSSQVGLLLGAMSAQMVVFSPIGGWLSDRYGRRLPAALGLAAMAAGALPYIAIEPSWGWPAHLVLLVVVGIGIGLSMAAVQTAAIEAASERESGQAAGLFSTMRYLGSITGSGLMAAILTGAVPSVSEFRLLYALLFVAACAGTLTAMRLPSVARPVAHQALHPAPTEDSVTT
ncbi:MAG TPA: MFS transporter [Thermomicrobiales bacterium]|nr:MFS transporter [Thermomicrobiales bacterium]